ncbi:MAG: VOC family protein [Thaumarchaeota archaeon]|nr:VOC family protein [Nitrososphaerota archaeon]
MIDHLNAHILAVKHLEECVAFYRDKLGFELKDKQDDFAYFVFDKKGGAGLGLLTLEAAATMISQEHIRPKEDTVHRDYFAVFVDDVDKEYAELVEKGVHFVNPPKTHPWGQRIAYFEDPEGNLWEVSTFLKK